MSRTGDIHKDLQSSCQFPVRAQPSLALTGELRLGRRASRGDVPSSERPAGEGCRAEAA